MTSIIRNGAALFGALSLSLPRRANGQQIAKPEEVLTAKCADFLRLAGPRDLFFCHIPNEAPRHVVGHVIQTAMGRVTGMVDIHILFRCQAFYVEIKTKGKVATEEQLECMRRLVLAGGRCAVVDSLEDFITQMRAWQIVP